MIEIDGSCGEGGGQILRSAIAMSAVFNEDVKIYNIRANRPTPGLSHQHYMAIKALKEFTDADVKGLCKGSTEIKFLPDEIKGGFYRFDIGTAGSVTLMIQAILTPAVISNEKLTLEIKGGTDVKWSPSYDYFENVFLAHLKNMGCRIESKLIKRGHYPKGGGKIRIEVNPSTLKKPSIGLKVDKLQGRVFVTNLPNHIADRMKKSALKELIDYPVSISTKSYNSESPGAGITLWTIGEKIVGCGILGEKGVPAEDIGKKAAEIIKDDIENEINTDRWASDQLIPFLKILEDGGIIKTNKLTGHLKTNIWVANQFPGKKIVLEEEGEIVKIIF
ncbi:MAG: RNA 3'-terminal phosphate cyclase [Thermoplasmatota archaeon]